MEKLMSWGQIDEIRAAAIIGEMDCPTCRTRLYPILVSHQQNTTLVCYSCPECNEPRVYDVKTRLFEREFSRVRFEGDSNQNAIIIPHPGEWRKLTKIDKRKK